MREREREKRDLVVKAAMFEIQAESKQSKARRFVHFAKRMMAW